MLKTNRSFPRPIRHFHTLPRKRLFSYCTYATGAEQHDNDHPILYLHGFPGSAVEGSLCASAASEVGCRLYGIDRPGFGYSHPLSNKNCDNSDDFVNAVVHDIWVFVKEMKWSKFSIVGVSGGGPYALAMLDFYISKHWNTNDQDSSDYLPKLEAVAIVAGICCSAGIDGMMKLNQNLYSIASCTKGWKGMLCWYFLLFQLTLQRFLLKVIPKRWLFATSSAMMKELPQADREVLDDDAVSSVFFDDVKESMRQGVKAAACEARALFRSKQGFEEGLKTKWRDLAHTSKEILPRVTIFQGLLDVNVPPSHSKYMQEKLLSRVCRLLEYPDLGHASLVVKKTGEIMKSVVSV